MTVATQQLGRDGEQLAVEYLRDAGYVILDRNWRCRSGEIDIIAREGHSVVFCEVKTRRSTRFGEPIEAITAEKVRRLRTTGMSWLAQAGLRRVGVRFDVISIYRTPDGADQVEHLAGAF